MICSFDKTFHVIGTIICKNPKYANYYGNIIEGIIILLYVKSPIVEKFNCQGKKIQRIVII